LFTFQHLIHNQGENSHTNIKSRNRMFHPR
jgi:hypothetical protein